MRKKTILFALIFIFILGVFVLVIGTNKLQRADREEETSRQAQEVAASEKNTEESTTVKESTSVEENTTEESTTAEECTSEEKNSKVTLSFVGDFYLSPMMYNNYQERGISGIISENIQNIFQSVDIAAADHEYVCADLDDSHKVTYQQYTFLTPTSREYILKDFGFDVMTLANNHMMDYKTEGLLSTIKAVREQGIEVIGGGNNLDEALKPYIAEVKGKKIAILAATRVVPDTEWYATSSNPGLLTTYESTDRFQMIKDEITRLKTEENCDIVIMYVHWGNDSDKTILNSQVQLGHGYIDAGADLVVGNHTHVLQGMEMYKGKLICYGISNFLFDSYHSDTMVLKVEIDDNNQIAAQMVPCISEGFYTTDLSGDAAEALYNYVESMSNNIEITDDGWITEK